MLNSSTNDKKFSFIALLVLLALFVLSSCMPSSQGPAVRSGSNSKNPSSGGTTVSSYPDPTFPLTGIFVQEGAVRTSSNFSLPLDFTDSFLIRGKKLSEFLRTVPNTTKFCIAGKYTYSPGFDRYLVMSAKPKSYTDLAAKTQEFYLQVEPSNDATNQNDCLSYNLTNTLFLNSTSPSVHFSLNQLCTNCTTEVTSSGLRLYFINGEEVPNLPVSSLLLTISRASTGTVQGCSDSGACKARGFDCCLNAQCVTDGALKPDAMSYAGFEAAQEDVRLNPDRFVVYPQFYFVCETRPEGTGSDSEPAPVDPEYEAAVRLMELNQLYACLNKVDGEFSHCTLKYPQADASIPGTFSAGTAGFKDDINFSTMNPYLGSGDKANNIVKIIYGGSTLYEQGKTPLTGGTFAANTINDNLTTAQGVNLTLPLPPNAKDANLYITYKVDGTCEKINATLSKCVKTYIQSYSDPTSTMWHDSSKIFKLPVYADTSATASVIVKVSGVVVPEETTTWSKVAYPPQIVFSGTYNIYQNQSVEITYFVKTSVTDIMKLRMAAQEQVNVKCSCSSGAKCNLKPIMDSTNTTVVNYECSYPVPAAAEPPANQTVFVSSKNTAHRYYDANGVNYDEDYGSAPDQELAPFKYTNNDVLKPNNVSQNVGFNEINGSYAKSGMYVARPAKAVRVKKDKLYDILVNSGAFSSCVTCGSDYYSSLQKIFPQNFGGQGGGYSPDNFENRRQNSSSIYRSDDLLYGRACFVPATMIPWSHKTSSSVTNQRRGRLEAQHFLFANGYNRDWYGFDYGSIIGSFDGVSWFSIGSQRRIKAASNKMYLAVNAYLGDLNVDNTFNVTVSESTAFSSVIPDHDTESNGAECQKSHYCSNDNDCFRQLGYDYACQNVTSIFTPWPQFDANGTEVVGSSIRSILSLVGGSNGQNKRCIYRGRGAPCLNDLHQASTTPTFNSSAVVGTLACSPNNACVPLNTAGRFNTKIARFANSPIAQNIANAAPTKSDLYAQGARIILRPFDYYGTQSTPTTTLNTLNANRVDAICLPGKNLSMPAATNFDLNNRYPMNRHDSSDKLYGVGPTSPLGTASFALNACPAVDDAGISLQNYLLTLGSDEINRFSISQNLSSNLLNFPAMVNQKIFSTSGGSQVTTVGYQKNACLRAAGASCFSDMECAPSALIASKAKAANLASVLNLAESKFWEEDLVCGNPDFKYVAPGEKNPDFNLKNNFCCREFGKTFTVYTQSEYTEHKWCDISSGEVLVAGVNMETFSATDKRRYSRVHSVYDKMTCQNNSPSKPFALSLETNAPTAPDKARNRYNQIKWQYKTLDTLNTRTCCTKNWVRSFAVENGGGHSFEKTKMQNIDKAMFRNISWERDNAVPIPGVTPAGDPDGEFECDKDNWTNPSCEIKSLTAMEEAKYLSWAGTLELIGIPQVAIKTDDQIFKIVNDTQQASLGPGFPLTDSKGKISIESTPSNADFIDESNFRYYSAANYSQMNMPTNTLKKVFSENEFNCCVPSGVEVPESVTAAQCCTGFISNLEERKCCLPDFTNLTVYLNRYVSSEGKGLPDSAYDPTTGYIKDPGQVRLLAAQKNLCCSGETAFGVAVSQLPIPLSNDASDPNITSRRFNYRSDVVDNNTATGSVGAVFDAGLRWNNHVYCVPKGFK